MKVNTYYFVLGSILTSLFFITLFFLILFPIYTHANYSQSGTPATSTEGIAINLITPLTTQAQLCALLSL